MYKSILVPLDGSAFAEHALPAAISVARQFDAKITLARVHIPLKSVYTEGVLFFDKATDKHFRDLDLAQLDATAKRIHDAFPAIAVVTKLLDGEIAEAVAEEVKSRGHDLVVLTTHGRGAIGRILLGSVADQLIRQVPTPLLVIRPTEKKTNLSKEITFKNILIPLDGSDLAEQIIGPAKALGTGETRYTLTRIIKPLQPADYPMEIDPVLYSMDAVLERVEAIHKEIRENAQTYLDGVAGRLRDEGQTVEVRIDEDAHPAAAMLRDAEEQVIDLIALATHGRKGLSRLFLGSVANKLIRSARVPVLVLRPKH